MVSGIRQMRVRSGERQMDSDLPKLEQDARQRILDLLRQLMEHRGVGQDVLNLLRVQVVRNQRIEQAGDVVGQLAGCPQAVPGHHFKFRKARLGHRRHIGHLRQAGFGGHCQGLEFPAGDVRIGRRHGIDDGGQWLGGRIL